VGVQKIFDEYLRNKGKAENAEDAAYEANQ
jgi:hypothetical protein